MEVCLCSFLALPVPLTSSLRILLVLGEHPVILDMVSRT